MTNIPADARPPRRQGGIPRTDLILSAHVAGNAEVFPLVMSLHVPVGSLVADVTWGKGVFWRDVPADLYRVLASDLADGTDCRNLPYADGYLDALVLDPPYMEGLLRGGVGRRAGEGSHAAFRERYSNGDEDEGGAASGAPRWHGAVRALYADACREAMRVLRTSGTLVVRCQDEVSAGRQWLTHVEIIEDATRLGFRTVDLFVVVRRNRPGVSRMLKQRHARKNHGYFLVFRKSLPTRPRNVIVSAMTKSHEDLSVLPSLDGLLCITDCGRTAVRLRVLGVGAGAFHVISGMPGTPGLSVGQDGSLGLTRVRPEDLEAARIKLTEACRRIRYAGEALLRPDDMACARDCMLAEAEHILLS